MKKATASFAILFVLILLPLPTRALSIDTNLNFGEFYGLYRDMDAGWRIEGSFTTANAIEFFICDAGNYSKWVNNQVAVLHEHRENAASHTFNFTIQHDAIWYVIFSNSKIASNISLEAEVRFINQLGVEQTQVDVITQNLISTPLVIAIVAAVIGICLLGIWWARRREPRPAVRYDEILSLPN
ncbi:MAG: hypothetical protein ACXABV_18950 [Candidatus Thorarchaeota archaeon]|jgi:hypothetical protein